MIANPMQSQHGCLQNKLANCAYFSLLIVHIFHRYTCIFVRNFVQTKISCQLPLKNKSLLNHYHSDTSNYLFHPSVAESI